MTATESSAVAEATPGICVLDDRGIVGVAGADAQGFLQGLVTNDVTMVAAGQAQYAALLTPQGKILFDFLLAADRDGGFLLDCPRQLAADLAKRLGFYRLRAKIAIEDRSATLGVAALWGDAAAGMPGTDFPQPEIRAEFADPRDPKLGRRVVAPRDALAVLPASARAASATERYEARRIRLEVPKGGLDFAYGDTFPHEANLDRLHGVDFNKGCFVGQEVVSRVEHRGLARKRVVAVRFRGRGPAVGTDILAGGVSLGVMGSSVEGRGLAMLRLDRVEAARTGGTPIVAGPIGLEIAA